jgi:ABC-type antimicrobial peptide transport system permease subunit
LALGASRGNVFRLVLSEGMAMILIGLTVGVIGSLAVTRYLSSLLYGVGPTDPLTIVSVSLILGSVALLACYIPARRAMKINPMTALRYE